MESNNSVHGEPEMTADAAPENPGKDETLAVEAASAPPGEATIETEAHAPISEEEAAEPEAQAEAAPLTLAIEADAEPEAQAEAAPLTLAIEADAEPEAQAEAAPLTLAIEAGAEPEAQAEAAPLTLAIEADAEPEAQAEMAPVTMEDWLDQVDRIEAEPKIKRGDILEGEVVQTAPTEILVDIGAKSEGVITGRELERMDRQTLGDLQVGQKVLVYVLSPEGRSGNPILSLTRAQEEKDWRTAEDYRQNQQVYESKIAGYNKGGLIVRFGRVRGFVPASQVSAERRRRGTGSSPNERWGHMVGEDIMVKVIEVDHGRNRLILSERAATREWRAKQKESLIAELQVGEQRRGRVISMADFGVFVDLGGADGLVHLTELSWKHITHPKEVVKVGQEVDVAIISIDRERRRIGLSIKQLEEDPWERLMRTHEVGQLVQGTITKLTKFGAFARIVGAEEIEGLIHISELADTRVVHPRDVVAVGDVLTLRIVKLDPDQRRLGLSVKQVDSADYAESDWQFEQHTAYQPEDNSPPTIGDVVGYTPEDASLGGEDDHDQGEAG
jgi:small subunit ribosomal protein S1